jgi:hypothetical protein
VTEGEDLGSDSPYSRFILKGGIMDIKKSIEINATPEKVWPFLVKPDQILKWCYSFEKCEYAGEQQSGIGTHYFIEENLGLGVTKMRYEVTDWKENQSLTMRIIPGKFVKADDLLWSVESTPTGSRYIYIESFSFGMGLIGRLISYLLVKMSASTIDKMLAKLKRVVEAG